MLPHLQIDDMLLILGTVLPNPFSFAHDAVGAKLRSPSIFELHLKYLLPLHLLHLGPMLPSPLSHLCLRALRKLPSLLVVINSIISPIIPETLN